MIQPRASYIVYHLYRDINDMIYHIIPRRFQYLIYHIISYHNKFTVGHIISYHIISLGSKSRDMILLGTLNPTAFKPIDRESKNLKHRALFDFELIDNKLYRQSDIRHPRTSAKVLNKKSASNGRGAPVTTAAGKDGRIGLLKKRPDTYKRY
jgi:hypothetical protein